MKDQLAKWKPSIVKLRVSTMRINSLLKKSKFKSKKYFLSLIVFLEGDSLLANAIIQCWTILIFYEDVTFSEVGFQCQTSFVLRRVGPPVCDNYTSLINK